MQEVKDEMKEQGREDEFIGSRVSLPFTLRRLHLPSANPRVFSKVIYCAIKIVTPEELEWYTEDCLALKLEFPDLIAGSHITFASSSLSRRTKLFW